MDQQIDGVKIAVNKDEGESNAPVVKIKKRPVPLEKDASSRLKKPGNKNRRGWLSIAIIIIATIAVAGGGSYFWREKLSEKEIEKIKEEARGAKIDFEQRLNNLKDTIAGMEKENVELKSASGQLADAENLLAKARIEYNNEDLGLSFSLPAILGQPEVAVAGATEKGMSFSGSFGKTEKISFGGVSGDYLPAENESTSTISILEIAGFAEKDKKYFLKAPFADGMVELEIKPVKQIEAKNAKVLLIDKKSFMSEEDGGKVDIGENIAAVVNLKNKTFSGLTFLNQDFGILPLAEFEDMLKTVEVR